MKQNCTMSSLMIKNIWQSPKINTNLSISTGNLPLSRLAQIPAIAMGEKLKQTAVKSQSELNLTMILVRD
jgi:hypothetical protein